MRKSLTNLLVLLTLSSSAWPQSVAGTGAVTGIVWDNLGDRLPDVEVVLFNDALNFRRTMTTTIDGVFSAAGLVPSTTYRLTVNRKGFTGVESKEFHVPVGQAVSLQFNLAPKPPAEQVTLPAELPPTDHSVNPGAANITPRQLELLPTSGRRWDTLALLAPAVTTDPVRRTLAIRGESLLNTQITDGVITSSLFPSISSPLTPVVSQDAIQELQVLPGDASTGLGRSMNGIVNIATRTGTNTLHGTAYGYGSNASFNALSRYALGNNLAGKRGVAGASLGGWVREHQVYFFSNFEAFDWNHQALNRITNPLLVDSTGTNVLPSACTATAALCSTATAFVKSQMNVLVPRSDHYLTGLARSDFRLTEGNSLSMVVGARHGRSPQNTAYGDVATDGGLYGSGTSNQEYRWGKLNWTSSFLPNVTNEFSFGLFANRISNPATNTGLSTGLLGINIAGSTLGATRSYNGIFSENRYQLTDNFTATTGAHTLTFGIYAATNQEHQNDLPNVAGTYWYNSLTDFAQDLAGGTSAKNYTRFTQQVGAAVRVLRPTELAFYTQDTWAATSRLQVTAGVRYDFMSVPQPNTVNSSYYNTGVISRSPADFSPRIGVAFRPDDNTVMRIGFGMYYAPFSGELLDTLRFGSGAELASIDVNSGWSGTPVFPHAYQNINSLSKGLKNLYWSTSKFRTQYSRDFNLAVERTLGPLSVEAGYITTSGHRLWTATDTNLTPPTKTPEYLLYDTTGAASTKQMYVWTARNDTNYSHLYQIGNDGYSSYRAFVLQARQRLWHGVGVHASYTVSRATSNVNGPSLVPGGVVALSSANTFLNEAEKGVSNLDQHHRAVINWFWQPMPMRNTSPLARYLVNGWELASITTLASGQSVTPYIYVNGQQFDSTVATLLYPTSLNGTGGWSRVPWADINSLKGEPQYTVNARITRTIPFTERIKALLQFEAYNLLNMQYNTSQTALAYIATGGVIRPVSSVGTANGAWLYPSGSNARTCQAGLRIIF